MKKPIVLSMTALLGAGCLFAEISATGGEIAHTQDGYVLQSFRSSGTLKVGEGGEVELLLVAGGGGGGRNGGGGGAGGVIYRESFEIAKGEYEVVIGEGGEGGHEGNGNAGKNGGDSSFAGLVAAGGGGGGGYSGERKGAAGGSGGGGCGVNNDVKYFTAGSGVEGQGFSGGDGIVNLVEKYKILCGGGGGAGGKAENCDSNTTDSTSGGIGVEFCQFNVGRESLFYAGGGGGGGRMNNVVKPGAGGKGGGGAGSATGRGEDAIANTGGGGGGGALIYVAPDWLYCPGGNGGSGILVLRYKQASLDTSMECEGGDIVEKDGDCEIRTFTKSGVFVADRLGTVEVLVVGGGGGGGYCYGGGGGGGGVLHSYYLLPSRTVQVTVGKGGACRESGENSSFGELVAYGGGAGGTDEYDFRDGLSGGSGGGGAGRSNYQQSSRGGEGISGQGYAGGIGTNLWAVQGAGKPGIGGGGGGAGSAGKPGTAWLVDAATEKHHGLTGDGGDGLPFSQFNKNREIVWYGGGGSGGSRPDLNVTIGNPGKGGGGKGTLGRSGAVAEDGKPNTGGGGGGGGFHYYQSETKKDWQGTPGGSGGSGIVIVRYKRVLGTMVFVK